MGRLGSGQKPEELSSAPRRRITYEATSVGRGGRARGPSSAERACRNADREQDHGNVKRPYRPRRHGARPGRSACAGADIERHRRRDRRGGLLGRPIGGECAGGLLTKRRTRRFAQRAHERAEMPEAGSSSSIPVVRAREHRPCGWPRNASTGSSLLSSRAEAMRSGESTCGKPASWWSGVAPRPHPRPNG